ncbi:NADH dehydrogenase [ubiquinone] 1 alpha subcomplex subunit 2 [Rhinatrema bivittatum]|uniref:NADH dehydrogenase [ubiquinone] 1 alpha subcomplex subunit 2 n=1 Tax=Rhinatrema bivittatum TaxID=194408 RepID=UPI0011276EE5|nr:NADH dehydrogenase [ubiquinone] 1 alpha subcomplex subunit 2 [Rhinatrema bivittatum]
MESLASVSPALLSHWRVSSGPCKLRLLGLVIGRGGGSRSGKMAAATVKSIGATLGRHLKEVRLHLCQSSAGSQGVRDFIEQNYVHLKKANPDFPILIRECSGVQPKLWARYEFGKERSLPLHNLNADQLAKALESLVKSKI